MDPEINYAAWAGNINSSPQAAATACSCGGSLQAASAPTSTPAPAPAPAVTPAPETDPEDLARISTLEASVEALGSRVAMLESVLAQVLVSESDEIMAAAAAPTLAEV